MEKSDLKVAFLGMGVMGSSMAANLAKAGYTVTIWNRTADRPNIEIATRAGATQAHSIADAVKVADIIFLCLGDVPDVMEVLLGENGVATTAKAGTLVVDTSTIGTPAAIEIAQKLANYHLHFLDAPVSGGDIGAKNGTLTIMVGGDSEDFAKCEPLLRVIGKNIRLCGPTGSGQSVKLCNQVLVSAYMIGICEALTLAEQLKLDPNLVIEMCGSGAAASWALSNLGPRIVQSDLAPGFAIAHMLKDLRLVQAASQDSPQKFPGVDLANQLFQQVAQLEDGLNQGTQAMIRAYQQPQD